jgi:hypothetical protein
LEDDTIRIAGFEQVENDAFNDWKNEIPIVVNESEISVFRLKYHAQVQAHSATTLSPSNPNCAKSFHLFGAREKDICQRTKELKNCIFE